MQNWADRTPDGFVMHIKAFGLMTRHPGAPRAAAARPARRDAARLARPRRPAAARAARGRVPRVPRGARAAAAGREARRDPLPDAALHRPEAVVVRLPRVGARPARRATRCSSSSAIATGSPPTGERRSCAGSRSGGCRTSRSTRPASTRPMSPRPSSRPPARSPTSASTAATPRPGTPAAAAPPSGSTTSTSAEELAGWVAPLARARVRGRADLCVLQQQQPDRRRRPGTCRRRAAPLVARRPRCPGSLTSDSGGILSCRSASNRLRRTAKTRGPDRVRRWASWIPDSCRSPGIRSSPYLEYVLGRWCGIRLYEEVGLRESDKEARHADRRGLRDRAGRRTDRGCTSSSRSLPPWTATAKSPTR